MSPTRTAVPDLLRRFASAPYHVLIDADVPLQVETNDLGIIAEMQTFKDRLGRRDCGGLSLLKIIRDQDAPCDGRTVTVFSAGPLVTVRRGVGTIIILDCERREALGFLAPNLTAEEFVSTLLPLVCNLLADSISTVTPI